MTRRSILTLLCTCTIYILQAQQWGLYTLIAPESKNAYLVDTATTSTSKAYHTWTFTTSTGYSAYLLPGGTIVRSVQNTSNPMGNNGGMTGAVQKVDWNGNVTWTFTYSTTTYCLHHDICPMPNGNILMISYEVKTATDASTAGCSTTMSSGIWSEKIIEVQPSGTSGYTIVWEWHLWDHLCQSVYSAKNNYVTSISAHPELMNINYSVQQDWFHMNGLDYNPYLDQIVFSSHNLNQIFVIDHSTTTAQAATHTGGNSGKGGDFLYRWGNPASYGVTGTTDFNIVHDAHWVKPYCPKGNYIGAFNNKGGTNSKSCVDLINPPYNGYNYILTNGAYTPATYDWRYTYTGSAAQDMGNSQTLPNGNTLVCTATSGTVLEIDTNQKTLWSIAANPAKAYRYSGCYVSGTLPATPSVIQSNDTLSSSANGTSYMWFLNGYKIDGAVSKTYIPAVSGIYQVQVYSSSDCGSEISAKYTFTATTTNLPESTQASKISIYPNPVSDIIHIDMTLQNINWEVGVYNVLGERVILESNVTGVSVSSFPNGIYLLVVSSNGKQLNNTKIIINH